MTKTSSFRASNELHDRLDGLAARSGAPKNRIIVNALEEYVDRHDSDSLKAEARRQSLLVSNTEQDREATAWIEKAADSAGWE